MFVYRAAGPSRLSIPGKLAAWRPREAIILTNGGLGCFVIVQRHMSRATRNPHLGAQDPRDRPGRTKEPGDVDAMKDQGKKIAKMGKRGQEKKPIDASVFPTLDVELIEEQKYPRELYFPYMPRKLRDWPIFAGFSLENALFWLWSLFANTGGCIKHRRLPGWRILKREYWRHNKVLLAIPSIPGRTFNAFKEAGIAANYTLALPAPVPTPPRNRKSKTSATVPLISAPGSTQTAPEAKTVTFDMATRETVTYGESPIRTSAASEFTSETTSPAITVTGNANPSLPDTLHPPVTRRPSIFSRRYWRVFFVFFLEGIPPPKLAHEIYMFLKPGYLRIHRFYKSYWDWRYLDPGYWSPQTRRESWVKMRAFRLDLWKNAVKYIYEAEKYGKDARAYYMKKLDNDRRNFNAMALIASKNRFPEYTATYGAASRSLVDSHWWHPQERERRIKENKLFKDLSSSKSPLSHILKTAKDRYIEMNKAVAEGRLDDLRQYAVKRYLNEIERRASVIVRQRSTMARVWKFERWVTEPECISIRAKDFFADYPGAYQGDYLVLNLLLKFDSWQSLETIERPEARASRQKHRPADRIVEKRRVTEYLIVDYRTWVWEGKPRFIQEVYPGQKLDIVTYTTSQKKLLERLRKKREEEEKESGGREAHGIEARGKAAELNPST